MSDDDKIKVAKTAGFCWGVKRAIDMTLETAKSVDGPVYTHGPLIHNPQALEMLEGKEVYAVDDATGLDSGATVIIRTHGVTPEAMGRIKARGLTVRNATCPLVARVQGTIKKYARRGYHTVIVGDRGHAEVTGLTGFAKGLCHVVGEVEEVSALPQMEKVCAVAQTTMDEGKYAEIVGALKGRFAEVVVGDTICSATRERQAEVVELAHEVDIVVVVGGKNSANTARLAQLARSAGAQTILIESEEELDEKSVRGRSRVGLTAGASTPSWMIERVHKKLNRLVGRRENRFVRFSKDMFKAFITSNVSVALGAVLMVFANSALAGFEFNPIAGFLAGAYIFSMYALNQLSDAQTFKHNEPEKIRFYFKNHRIIQISAVIASGLSLLAAFLLGWGVFAVYVGALALGLGYTVKWFPTSDFIRIHRLKDIPASKDVFVGMGWVAMTVVIPARASGANLLSSSVLVAVVFTFIIVYIRSVLSDIRDIHGDRLVGRETIPIIIGKTYTKVFLISLALALAVLLVVASALGWASAFGYLALGSVGYTAVYLALYHARIISSGVVFDLAIDGVFYITGLLALLWTFAL